MIFEWKSLFVCCCYFCLFSIAFGECNCYQPKLLQSIKTLILIKRKRFRAIHYSFVPYSFHQAIKQVELIACELFKFPNKISPQKLCKSHHSERHSCMGFGKYIEHYAWRRSEYYVYLCVVCVQTLSIVWVNATARRLYWLDKTKTYKLQHTILICSLWTSELIFSFWFWFGSMFSFPLHHWRHRTNFKANFAVLHVPNILQSKSFVPLWTERGIFLLRSNYWQMFIKSFGQIQFESMNWSDLLILQFNLAYNDNNNNKNKLIELWIDNPWLGTRYEKRRK